MRASLRRALSTAVAFLAAADTLYLRAGDEAFEAHIVARHWAEAEKDAAARIASAPDDTTAAADLARVIVLSNAKNRFEEAAQLLERAVAAQPTVASHYFYLGRAYGGVAQAAGGLGALGTAKKSKAAFMRAVELEPRSFEYIFALNEYLLAAPFIAGGNGDKARKNADEFASVDADASALLKAQVLGHKKDFVAAAKLVMAVESRGDKLLDVTRRLLLVRIGLGMVEARRARDALPIFDAVTTEFPNNAAGHLGLGRARYESGDFAGAVTALARSTEIDDHPDAWYRLGLAHASSGDLDKARDCLRTSLQKRGEGKAADEVRRKLTELGG